MNSNSPDGTSVKKYGLALHTSTPELGLAISNFSGDSRCQTWNLGRSLATDLHQHLVEFIGPQTWADLAFIAVAKGPGGFTGTRMGMVTARTLAQQLDIPVFTISTLAAVAWLEPPQASGLLELEPPQASGGLLSEEVPQASGGLLRDDIALQMPAQRGQLFGAVYSVNSNSGVTELFSDTVMTAESWQEKLGSWENSYQLIEVGSELGSSVSGVLELAYLEWKQGIRPDWWDALPYYGQHPVQGK
ncbi:MAG: tRNA (adenosine(37)-N6)-threonylcarbamoyltransferase complex dimerization subunit type 1 TsaB [Microcoleus sp. PH2017_10_PVI_O_A]|uniref:tRNA (adenosine(37)-N6)-threonylcarbamoyltransferase complex dimerization subunit type 1 TsaB n=1 Tax=unclassified Microcoleus TaxID=2642155 RepID=UPI001D4B0037|nr:MULTISPECIES: tRNA (adenosine(37)-N6)-threonylcarbamoyltransferase complex dimerization subunit type 1 TsaB [unclassified Microcoleus]TAE83124.1 MAG: tRNA (adenosine(37)-N6)-threonylcarbamoyltransferase complex dimerization subunit type 1 TsaB [Oscillatoriales cyanobacterium]MCC3406357.1 tRNA (adenosine(37)-N6)-threonylcarbamoyltransferase complex dimerization subunit type 1 TsaB [Microcoleus sp. PH2017_10_PVI_O_A]MCC3460341.1 tRNA (adenosine(37)-N6)-threonylcarbamoyltransferase complex dimer